MSAACPCASSASPSRASFPTRSTSRRPTACGSGRRSWRRAQYGITPYGTEAMHLLRAEKGFVIVGQETDGTVTPDDLGLGGMVKKAGDFIGRRSLSRADTKRDDRKQLVGLLTGDYPRAGGGRAADGRHRRARRPGAHARARDVELPQRGARPLVRAGARRGWAVHASDKGSTPTTPGGFTQVRVCEPVFFDPQGRAGAWLRRRNDLARRTALDESRCDAGSRAAALGRGRHPAAGAACALLAAPRPVAPPGGQGGRRPYARHADQSAHGVGGESDDAPGSKRVALVGHGGGGCADCRGCGGGPCRPASLSRRRRPPARCAFALRAPRRGGCDQQRLPARPVARRHSRSAVRRARCWAKPR